MRPFILSDDSLNSSGFRVLTDGIDLSDFIRNPVMLWNHTRNVGDNSAAPVLPIGKWVNIQKENGVLMAEPYFDSGDQFAMQIARKVENGYINSCSIGFDPLTFSEADAHKLPGQSLPTVLTSRLIECSLCDIPVNANARQLSLKAGQPLTLSHSGLYTATSNNNNMNNGNGWLTPALEQLGFKELEKKYPDAMQELHNTNFAKWKALAQADPAMRLGRRMSLIGKPDEKGPIRMG